MIPDWFVVFFGVEDVVDAPQDLRGGLGGGLFDCVGRAEGLRGLISAFKSESQ